MKKVLGFFFCICLTGALNNSYAFEKNISSIDIEKSGQGVNIIFKTSADMKFIAYDIVQPPQIIVDVIDDGLTDIDEEIPVYFGGVEEIKAVKSSYAAGGCYGVDFWVVELTQPVEYRLSYKEGDYILSLTEADTVDISGEKSGKCASVISLPAVQGSEKSAVELRQEGYCYQVAGEYSKAMQCYSKATEQDPSYAAPYNDLGVIYYIYLNDAQKAIEKFNKALDLDPYCIGAHTNLALIHESLNNKKEALKHWTERVRLGNDEDYWTGLAKQKVKGLKTVVE